MASTAYFGVPYSNDMDFKNPKQRREDCLGQNPDYRNFNVPLMRQDKIIERPADQNTLTKRYTEEALKFIRKNSKQPFFLYLAHTFPHVPLFASKDFRGKSLRGLYGDAVEELDWSVGEVLKALRAQKLADTTLVFFTSDNGPWLIQGLNGGSAGLLRDGKGGTWEGGHRVPAIAWWPGKIQPGRITSELASGMDLFNTCLGLAGAAIPNDRVIDGVDMRPVLLSQGPSQRDTLFLYYGSELHAIRKGKFKAHYITHDGYSKAPAEKHDPPLLMQVERDPSEKVDVASEHSEELAAIQRELEKHRANLVPGKPQY